MIGFFLFLLTPLAWVLVPIFATIGWYPKFVLTPDDPVSPFGKNESTVVAIYAKYGRWVGDVYWLAFRNVFYGLAYYFKPDEFKRMSDYGHVHCRVSTSLFARKIAVAVYGFGFDSPDQDYYIKRYTERTFYLGPVAVIVGYRLWPVASNSDALRHPNMDARPCFSVRLTKNT